MEIFIPADSQSKAIYWTAPCVVFDKVVTSEDPVYEDFVIGEKTFNINLASPRLQMLKSNPCCSICGIIGTHMALELYYPGKDYKKPIGNPQYHWMLYAQTQYKSDSSTHMTLMTAGHIVDRKKGGSNNLSNLQTECWLCNVYKDNLGSDNESLRRSTFNAFRIHRSSFSLTTTKKNLEGQYKKLKGLKKFVEHVDRNIRFAQEKTDMVRRKNLALQQIQELESLLNKTLIRAQVTGTVFTHLIQD